MFGIGDSNAQNGNKYGKKKPTSNLSSFNKITSSIFNIASRKETNVTSPSDNVWSFPNSIVTKPEKDEFEEKTIPLNPHKDRNENYKRKDCYNKNVTKDKDIKKKSKDVRSLLQLSEKDDIEFLRKSVEETIKTTVLNEYFGTFIYYSIK